MEEMKSLEGLTYDLDGCVETLYKNKTLQKLEALGCHLAPKSKDPSFLICGRRAGVKKRKAIEKGIPVITPTQVKVAVRQGEIQLFYLRDSGDANPLFGQVRSLLTEPVDEHKWIEILEVLEQCKREQSESLAHYVVQCMNVLDRHESISSLFRWSPDMSHPLFGKPKSRWALSNPLGELQVAPPVWVHEMLSRRKDSYHPKHQLVRALNLSGLVSTPRQFEKILNNPYLKNVHHINLGHKSARLTTKIIQNLSEYPAIQGVETIVAYNFNSNMLEAFEANPAGSLNIKSLDFVGCLLRYGGTDGVGDLHYGDMEEEAGLKMLERLMSLPCFVHQPKFSFHYLR